MKSVAGEPRRCRLAAGSSPLLCLVPVVTVWTCARCLQAPAHSSRQGQRACVLFRCPGSPQPPTFLPCLPPALPAGEYEELRARQRVAMAEQMALDAEMLKKADAAKMDPAVSMFGLWWDGTAKRPNGHGWASLSKPHPAAVCPCCCNVCLPVVASPMACSPLLPCDWKWEKRTAALTKERRAPRCRRQSPVGVDRARGVGYGVGRGPGAAFRWLHAATSESALISAATSDAPFLVIWPTATFLTDQPAACLWRRMQALCGRSRWRRGPSSRRGTRW